MSYLLIALLFSARPVDPIAAETLTLALERSPTVRSLIDALEHSNVVVHIQSSREMPSGIGGTTQFVTSRGGYRYLRITIRGELPLRERVIILAHELQHACEMAQWRADDAASLRELFARAGHRVGDYYETRAAQETERQARMELSTRRMTLQAEPVAKFHH